MIPPVVRNGVCLVLMDLFSEDRSIAGDVTIDGTIVDGIKITPIVIDSYGACQLMRNQHQYK